MKHVRPANVLKCSCKNEGQDKIYGKGYRLHNTCKKGTSGTGFRCTVCKNVNK